MSELNMTTKKFYVADITVGSDGAITYSTPEAVCGVAEVAVAYTKNPVKVYEGGRTIYNKTRISDAKVTLSTHTLPLAKRMELFFGLDAPEAGEAYEEGADTDAPKDVAIGWPVLQDDGKYLCFWFYQASAVPPDESYKTSDDQGPKIEPMSIEFNCSRTEDGKLRRSKVCTAAEMATFFQAVVPAGAGG